MEKEFYIHYGTDTIDPSLIEKDMQKAGDELCPKKPGGLWASPVESVLNWRDWCEGNDFHTDRLNKWIIFSLKPEARVLHVRKPSDLPYQSFWEGFRCIDLEPLYRNYDAMELHMDEGWDELRYHDIFYPWDVDSICVWNPEVIEVFNEKGEISPS